METNAVRVMYVEDNPDDQQLLQDLLAEVPDCDLEIVAVTRLDQAIELCSANPPDVVLLDLNLPDSQGISTFQTIASKFPLLPIIILTATDRVQVALEAVRSGAQDFLAKGEFTGHLVARSIQYAIERKAFTVTLSEIKMELEKSVRMRTTELIQANKALKKEIKDRNKAQKDLSESRHMLRLVTDNIPAMVGFVDKDRRYRFVNRTYEQYFNRPLDRILGEHSRDLYGEMYDSLIREHVDTVLSGQPTHFEVSMQSPDGKTRHCYQASYLPRFNEAKEVDGFFVLGSDITERKAVEENLREQRQLLQNVLDGLDAAVFLIDLENYTIVECNIIAEKLLGIPTDKIIGAKCHMLICMEELFNPDKGCPVYTTKILDREFTLERPDGTPLPVTKSVLPVIINGRRHHVAIIFDITKRKDLERQLTYAQKLESVGMLAAGIAHEINTPIQYVGDNIHFLIDTLKDVFAVLEICGHMGADLVKGAASETAKEALQEALDKADIEYTKEEVPKALKQMLQGVEHVSGIVQAMKRFSHPDGGEKSLVDINAAVENTITIARNEWKYHSEIVTELDPELPLVHGFAGDINQALLNTLVNAAHAVSDAVKDTSEKGTITIRTSRREGMVEIQIQDTGTGISEQNRSRIFNPFFTTKPVGKGTGQGLAITHEVVVRKHNGVLDFTSEEGQGTTFIIQLPAHGTAGENHG